MRSPPDQQFRLRDIALTAYGPTIVGSTGYGAVTPVLALRARDLALIAVGNGLGSGIVMTLGADAAPMTGRGQFLGAWRLCGDIGLSGGPLVVSAAAALAPLAAAASSWAWPDCSAPRGSPTGPARRTAG